MTWLVAFNRDNLDLNLFGQVVDRIRAGQVVAYPTETFYGLGVDVANELAIKRLFDVKRRDYSNPIAVIVADQKMLTDMVEEIPETAQALMEKFWPGPLTILFKTQKISKQLTTNTGKIGIRISSDPIAAELVKALGRPLTTTSANLSGHPPSFSAQEVQGYFDEKIDCIIDAGDLPPSLGSTVVDVTEDKMVLIREGILKAESIFKLFEDDLAAT